MGSPNEDYFYTRVFELWLQTKLVIIRLSADTASITTVLFVVASRHVINR